MSQDQDKKESVEPDAELSNAELTDEDLDAVAGGKGGPPPVFCVPCGATHIPGQHISPPGGSGN